MSPNLETAVQDDKVMQGFKLESFSLEVEHSQKAKATSTGNDLKNYVNLPSSTAVSRFKKLCFLAIFFSCLNVYGETPFSIKDPTALINNELIRLDGLLQATEQSLEGQKKLRVLIVEYKKLQEDYLKKPKDNDLLLKVVKSAYRTLKTIKENNLLHTFDSDFIDELTVLSQPATKRGIPKP